jgi:hypothetical protein
MGENFDGKIGLEESREQMRQVLDELKRMPTVRAYNIALSVFMETTGTIPDDVREGLEGHQDVKLYIALEKLLRIE